MKLISVSLLGKQQQQTKQNKANKQTKKKKPKPLMKR